MTFFRQAEKLMRIAAMGVISCNATKVEANQNAMATGT